MITIHRYQFELANEFEIEMPSSAMILSVQENQGRWCLWARVDTELLMVKRKFVAFWTGEKLPRGFASLNYIATIQDSYVWHLFEQVNQLTPSQKGDVLNTMQNFDPKEATQEVKGEGQEAAPETQATEQDAQEKALENAEEGGAEG